jgi:hypothetical protein
VISSSTWRLELFAMRVDVENHGYPQPAITLSGRADDLRRFFEALLGVGEFPALLTLVWVADRREACGGWTEAVLSRSV